MNVANYADNLSSFPNSNKLPLNLNWQSSWLWSCESIWKD